jgi:cystathionine beta-lyase/cystathionine gamma-synthase
LAIFVMTGASAITYSSGLAAISAVFQVFQPKRIWVSDVGYHETKQAIHLYAKGRQVVRPFSTRNCGAVEA